MAHSDLLWNNETISHTPIVEAMKIVAFSYLANTAMTDTMNIMNAQLYSSIKGIREINYNRDEELWDNHISSRSIYNSGVEKSLEKLRRIESLEENWNGDGAKRISRSIIKKAERYVMSLSRQPQIFPISYDAIQFEYDGYRGSYLEIEIDESNSFAVYKIDQNGKESSFEEVANIDNINKLVEDFYG